MIRSGPLLRERTTIRLGGRAIAEIRPGRESDLEAVPELVERCGGSPVVLGGGSNYLFEDGELPVVLLSLDRAGFDAPPRVEGTVREADGEKTLLRVSGVTKLQVALRAAAALGLTGLEGLAGIPGTVGGAVAMNAGSYGVETGACLRRLRVFTPKHGFLTLTPEDWDTAYRRFQFRVAGKPNAAWFLVLDATFALARAAADPTLAMQAALDRKTRSQPVSAKSAGCVFQNPAPGVSAGRLLEEAGFRGRGLGGMEFSAMHANFLVNQGNGTSEQALELIRLAQEAVFARSGYALKLEVRLCAAAAEVC